MSQAIWKYNLEVTDEQTIKMPENSKILCVQTQRGEPRIWAIVDTENRTIERKFWVIRTGHKKNAIVGEYVGSFQMMGGALVFHVFAQENKRQ